MDAAGNRECSQNRALGSLNAALQDVSSAQLFPCEYLHPLNADVCVLTLIKQEEGLREVAH